MLRPNPSTAENKLNLFPCFASPFLPFLFQIAKKTSLRWREGRRKQRMENIVCAGIHLLSAWLGKGRVCFCMWKLEFGNVLFPLCEDYSLALQRPQLFFFCLVDRITRRAWAGGWEQGTCVSLRAACSSSPRSLSTSASTRTGISIFTPVSSHCSEQV